MNNKGFTLIELLAVVVILSIIAVLIFPTFNNIIRSSKDEINKTNTNEVLNAAYNWSLENNSSLPTANNASINVTIETLKKSGYLKKDAINIDTLEAFSDSCYVNIKKITYKQNMTEPKNSRYYSDYLFKLNC